MELSSWYDNSKTFIPPYLRQDQLERYVKQLEWGTVEVTYIKFPSSEYVRHDFIGHQPHMLAIGITFFSFRKNYSSLASVALHRWVRYGYYSSVSYLIHTYLIWLIYSTISCKKYVSTKFLIWTRHNVAREKPAVLSQDCGNSTSRNTEQHFGILVIALLNGDAMQWSFFPPTIYFIFA